MSRSALGDRVVKFEPVLGLTPQLGLDLLGENLHPSIQVRLSGEGQRTSCVLAALQEHKVEADG